MLYLVPTPIGNLEDITHRALRVLGEADLILAEDTRTTGNLLRHFGISRPLASFHIHNEHQRLGALIRQLKEGRNLVLVSDAGTPGISDPGFLLVREVLREGLDLCCLPGPTALIPALVVSGFPTDRFLFEGFLPTKKGRQTRLRAILNQDCTVVLYESPHRVRRLMDELDALGAGGRPVSLSREISKKFEETWRGTVSDACLRLKENEPKGEYVVVISARSPGDEPDAGPANLPARKKSRPPAGD